MSLTEELHQKLIDKFQEESFLDCFVVAIEQKGKQVSVYLDSDSAITFERCKMISRYLESWLDEKKLIGEDYILEVSSAGLTRSLIFPRQFVKNIGRGLTIETEDDQKIEGTLIAADQERIELEWMEERKENKKKIKEIKKAIIPYHNIKEAKIIIKI